MGKLMSAALMMMVAGCGAGLGPDVVMPEAPHERLKLQGPETMTDLVLFGEARQGFVKERVLRKSVGAGVNVTGVLGAEGKVLRAVVGQAGCGFSVEGHGQATVVNGVALVALSGIPADRKLDLVLELDTDGDGKCSQADTMWSGSLTTTQDDATVAVDLAALTAGPNWMCFAINDSEAP